MIQIELTQGYFATIDDEDYDLVNQHLWCLKVGRNTNYAKTNIVVDGKRRTLLMHQLIMNTSGRENPVDHVNRNGLDNRKNNLRKATCQQNKRNSVKDHNSHSSYKGVSYRKETNKFRARITINRKTINIGNFINEIYAAKSYDEAAKFHF